VTVLRGKRVELRGDARNPIALGGDGEALGVLPALDAGPAVVEIQPGALSVIAPS
jgi:diacylglycerol kinase (ATP)